ncbi:MAG: ATP-binding protein [bacterium]|nr:ATP-binding protein [bacterium]
MPEFGPFQSVLWAAIFSGIVLIIILFEYRRVRGRLLEREKQMRRRMYELSILRELGERIGYSLNVQKIVDIIGGSLTRLLPFSIVAYMLPTEDDRVAFHITLEESVNKTFLTDVKGRMLKAFNVLFAKDYVQEDIEESIAGVITDPTNEYKIQSYFNVPIVINNKPAGILTVASSKSGLYKTNEEVEILYTIVNQASEAVSKLETVLEIEKGKLNAMVASMADGVLMVDTHNRLLVTNAKAVEMMGLKSSNPSIFDVLDSFANHIDLRTKIEESVKRDQIVIENEIQLNNYFLQILISPVKNKKNEPLGSVVLLHDITHEKEVEKMRDDFTSMMVHELRSPLTGIRSIAALLKNEKIKAELQKYQEFVDLISTNSTSMLDLVNDLLDVAKLESGKFEVFKKPSDLRLVIDQRIKSFMSLASDGKLGLEKNILTDVPQSFDFDDIKVSQVLNNLLSNAIKFTGAGGKIIVSAFLCQKSQDIAQLAVEKNIPWAGAEHGILCPVESVVVNVTDTGVGIPQSQISKLFNKFQQLAASARSEKKGTGLGLVIAKGVVEAHGGLVGCTSEEGKGTTFYFTLPLNSTK